MNRAKTMTICFRFKFDSFSRGAWKHTIVFDGRRHIWSRIASDLCFSGAPERCMSARLTRTAVQSIDVYK